MSVQATILDNVKAMAKDIENRWLDRLPRNITPKTVDYKVGIKIKNERSPTRVLELKIVPYASPDVQPTHVDRLILHLNNYTSLNPDYSENGHPFLTRLNKHELFPFGIQINELTSIRFKEETVLLNGDIELHPRSLSFQRGSQIIVYNKFNESNNMSVSMPDMVKAFDEVDKIKNPGAQCTYLVSSHPTFQWYKDISHSYIVTCEPDNAYCLTCSHKKKFLQCKLKGYFVIHEE